MAMDLADLPAALETALAGPLIGSLTTLRPDGSPHVTCVGPSWDPADRIVRIISRAGTVKARNLATDDRAAVTWIDGGSWATFEGRATVTSDEARVRPAMEAYRARWGDPREDLPDRIAIEVRVERALGRWFG